MSGEPGAPHQVTDRLAYRADIDGLRAVAVLLVVLYHAFPGVVAGGFVGVDVFFVISGYLITGIILDDLRSGRFTFTEFYVRRIRRILPALSLVLAACLVFSLTPWFAGDRGSLYQHSVAASLFGSNFLLWSEAGYFDSAQHLKPLLHLWSLAVEEQFYLVWPVLLAGLWRRLTAWLVWVTSGLLLLSFLANVVLVGTDMVQAFYSPLPRFWELLVGGLLAVKRSTWAWTRDWAATLFIGGLLLILLPVGMLDRYSSFPGWWAALPVIGSSFLIVAGSARPSVQGWLGSSVLVALGRISYPLYLWHWPLLSLTWMASGTEPSVLFRTAMVVLSLVLAWLTHRYVELPLRRVEKGRTRRLALALLLLLICLGAFAYSLRKNIVTTASPGDSHYLDTQAWRQEFRHGTCFVDGFTEHAEFAAECVGESQPGDQRPLVVLWGDSHAASLYQGLLSQSKTREFAIAQFTASLCPPIMDFAIRWRPSCPHLNRFVLQRIRELRPDTVIMGAFWSAYNGQNDWPALDQEKLKTTMQAVRTAGVRQLVLVGHLPLFDLAQPIGVATFVPGQRDRTLLGLAPRTWELDATVGAIARSVDAKFLSPLESLCNKDGCLVSGSLRELQPLTWDNQHLNAEGSRLLLEIAVQRGVLTLPKREARPEQ